MIQTVEAVVDEHGKVQLLQAIQLSVPRRTLVTILDEGPLFFADETALLSEAALAEGLEPDPRGRGVVNPDLVSGGLRVASYSRPGKLFTAHERLIAQCVGKLRDNSLCRVVDAVVALLRMGTP